MQINGSPYTEFWQKDFCRDDSVHGTLESLFTVLYKLGFSTNLYG
jgi:hypothetical protein